MKENFLTDETAAVFKPAVKKIADEYGCTPSFIYKILEHEKNDPFQPWLEWYSACVRAGADVSHWDNRLALVRAKYNRTNLDHRAEAARLGCETADVTRVVLTDAPLYDQLTEACQAQQQAERTVKAILNAINAEKDEYNGRRSRLPIDISEKVKQRKRA